MVTASAVGTTAVGSDWMTMSSNVVYLQSDTVPGDSLVTGVVSHLRHQVANVPHLGAFVAADNSGVPGLFVATPSQDGNAVLMTSTGRWVSFPVGLWVPSSTLFWYGITLTGSTSFDLARETTGGDGGSLASRSEQATWTSGANDYSIYLQVLS